MAREQSVSGAGRSQAVRSCRAVGRAGWVSKALRWGWTVVSAGQGCWSKYSVQDMESLQSGIGEPSMLPALGISGNVCI